MDLPVVAIKFRDYIFWFGPIYLAAIALGAASEVILRRVLEPQLADEPSVLGELGLLYALWQRVTGPSSTPHRLSPRLYLWLALSSRSIAWMPLLMTAALNWPLSLLRLGTMLILASLLATLLPPTFARRDALLGGLGGSPASKSTTAVGISRAPLYVQWWQTFGKRFAKTSNGLVLGAALGGALIGLAPSFYALLTPAFTTAPLSYVSGVLIGTLAMLAPGTDAPLIAAFQARGAEGTAIALMLGVSAGPLRLALDLRGLSGRKAAALYGLSAGLLTVVVAWLLNVFAATN